MDILAIYQSDFFIPVAFVGTFLLLKFLTKSDLIGIRSQKDIFLFPTVIALVVGTAVPFFVAKEVIYGSHRDLGLSVWPLVTACLGFWIGTMTAAKENRDRFKVNTFVIYSLKVTVQTVRVGDHLFLSANQLEALDPEPSPDGEAKIMKVTDKGEEGGRYVLRGSILSLTGRTVLANSSLNVGSRVMFYPAESKDALKNSRTFTR